MSERDECLEGFFGVDGSQAEAMTKRIAELEVQRDELLAAMGGCVEFLRVVYNEDTRPNCFYTAIATITKVSGELQGARAKQRVKHMIAHHCDSCNAKVDEAEVTDENGDLLPPAYRLCWKCRAEYQKAMRERMDEGWDEPLTDNTGCDV
jgi:hypothetical protein